MPLYAYECEACHVEFERQQSFSDDPIRVCPECGAPSVRRLIKPVGIIFRGPGFYVTDNRKASGNGKGPNGNLAKDSGSKKGAKEKSQSTTTA